MSCRGMKATFSPDAVAALASDRRPAAPFHRRWRVWARRRVAVRDGDQRDLPGQPRDGPRLSREAAAGGADQAAVRSRLDCARRRRSSSRSTNSQASRRICAGAACAPPTPRSAPKARQRRGDAAEALETPRRRAGFSHPQTSARRRRADRHVRSPGSLRGSSRQAAQPTPDELDAGSLYAWLAKFCGQKIAGARECIEAALADAAMARRLEVAPGSALLVARRRSHAQDRRPIEYAIMHYRADRYRFVIELAGNSAPQRTRMTALTKADGTPSAKPQVLPPKAERARAALSACASRLSASFIWPPFPAPRATTGKR